MDNYYDTANRMYKSSQTLHNNREFHNACYMSGYVIECYMKIMHNCILQSMPPFTHKLQTLDTGITNYLVNGNSSFSTYLLDRSSFTNIFNEWDPVSRRYIELIQEWQEQNSNDFQNEIHLAMQELTKMKLDGNNLI